MFSLFGEYCWFVSKNGISTITHANNDVSNTYSDVMYSFDSLEQQLLVYASFYITFLMIRGCDMSTRPNYVKGAKREQKEM